MEEDKVKALTDEVTELKSVISMLLWYSVPKDNLIFLLRDLSKLRKKELSEIKEIKAK